MGFMRVQVSARGMLSKTSRSDCNDGVWNSENGGHPGVTGDSEKTVNNVGPGRARARLWRGNWREGAGEKTLFFKLTTKLLRQVIQ